MVGSERRDNEDSTTLSAVIEAVLRDAEARPVTLGDLFDRTGDRGFGVLLLVLGLPMLVPFLPPGSSTLVGPIYSVFAIQMLKGSPQPWMPVRFRGWILTSSTVRTLRERGLPFIRAAERFSRPRGLWVSERVAVRVSGVMVFLMGIVLLSPLPFLNTIPAISVMLIGMGLLNRDAAFMLAGVAVGGLALGLIGLSAELIVVVIERIRQALQ